MDLTDLYDGKRKDVLQEEKHIRDVDRTMRKSQHLLNFDGLKLADKKPDTPLAKLLIEI